MAQKNVVENAYRTVRTAWGWTFKPVKAAAKDIIKIGDKSYEKVQTAFGESYEPIEKAAKKTGKGLGF